MKKKLFAALLIVPFFLCYVVVPAMAITWHTANQSTVAWDAVTTDVDGDPIPAGSHVEYKVYLVNAQTDPNKANPAEVGQTAETQLIITLNTKGSYYVGVTSLLIDDATNEQLGDPSAFAWSDNPAQCQGGVDFGIRFFAPLVAPGALRSVSTP